MLKGSLSLLLVLGFMVVCLGGMRGFSVMTENQREVLRVQRSEIQTLQQQLSVLQKPDMPAKLVSLQADQNALRIQLLEVLEARPWPTGVKAVEYQHTMLPRVLVGPSSEVVSMLRLELHLQVQHAISFLDLLDRISEAIAVWPHEIRGCEIRRQHQQPLDILCALDFYHWRHSDLAVSDWSAGSRRLFGSVA